MLFCTKWDLFLENKLKKNKWKVFLCFWKSGLMSFPWFSDKKYVFFVFFLFFLFLFLFFTVLFYFMFFLKNGFLAYVVIYFLWNSYTWFYILCVSKTSKTCFFYFYVFFEFFVFLKIIKNKKCHIFKKTYLIFFVCYILCIVSWIYLCKWQNLLVEKLKHVFFCIIFYF